ncbi:MAG: efflux RND transporter periplasmic adaptor subunit [Schwartzia sp.]|nr:efflux RND transporter periplasmic adaptor subunit [Schwartzia sp. (in: firmicutes)]
MDAQKYLKIAIVAVIAIVIFVVGYGIYINEASRRHIDKMEAAQYTVLPVAHADYRDIHAVVENVNLTARAAWTIDITAQYEGVLDGIFVRQGQRVEPGDMLATMNNNDLAAKLAGTEADIEEARAKLINAEQTVNRYQYLVENNAISVQEYDSAVAQRDAARAQLESKTAQRDLIRSEESKMIVTAPQEASVIQVYRESGKYVRAGEPIFMLAELRQLSAFSVMSHEEMERLMAVGGKFILEIQPHRLTNKAYPMDDKFPPTSLRLNQFLLSMTSAVPDASTDVNYHEVTWQVENPTGIMEPTYYDNVTILSRDTVRVLAVPSRAVHRDNKAGDLFVYTLDDESRLVRRKVACGINGRELVEITDGLSQGDRVVIADPSEYSEGLKVGEAEYEF